jgi:hypothetical protein
MAVNRDQTGAGPEPARQTYDDGAYGSEEQRTQADGSENVGAAYSTGTVRTTGNMVLGIVALIAFATLIGLYLLLVAMR